MTATDYLRQLQALLPPGAAWPRDDDAALSRLLAAAADELARIDRRAEQLIDEADPRTTAEMLADWERVAGLPDPCVAASGEAQSVPQRHAALVARLAALGGQAAAYFIALAASLGYAITIEEFRPFRAGASRAGDALTNGDWSFTWRVYAPPTTPVTFRAGQSAAGDALRSWSNVALECVLNRFKPAHTNLLFAYGYRLDNTFVLDQSTLI